MKETLTNWIEETDTQSKFVVGLSAAIALFFIIITLL